MTASQLLSLGYRNELDVFAPGEHNSFAVLDQYAPAAAFLGDATVDRDPAHVTYVVAPAHDYPRLGLVTDHAYWLEGLHAASPAGGQIDARSRGFGTSDPAPSGLQTGAGTLGGTNILPAVAYVRAYQIWGPAPAAHTADEVDITASGISSATIDVARAHVDCNAKLVVHSDVHLHIALAGCGATSQAPGKACTGRTITIHLRRAHVTRVAVYVNGRLRRALHSRRGIRRVRVTLRGVAHVTLRLRVNGRTLVERHTYRACRRR
jgi:hypothetical protein